MASLPGAAVPRSGNAVRLGQMTETGRWSHQGPSAVLACAAMPRHLSIPICDPAGRAPVTMIRSNLEVTVRQIVFLEERRPFPVVLERQHSSNGDAVVDWMKCGVVCRVVVRSGRALASTMK